MAIETMGKVVVTAKIENLEDLILARRGLIPASEARSVEVDDALVDTGATQLSLPRRLIQQLGLVPVRTQRARTSAGVVSVQIYETALVTVQGRTCGSEVTELPDECPVLIGQVPLEVLDFVVDPRNRKLVGNPEHGGEQMTELY